MSGRPDHAAARWADDAAGGVEEAGQGSVTDVGPPEVDAAAPGGPVAADEGAADGATVADDGGGDGGTADDGGILADVAAISAQRDEYLESLQRLKADFDNYRKRVARLQEEQTSRAEANIVGKLLPVLDNLDLAWAHLGPRGGNGERGGGAAGGAFGGAAGGASGGAVSEEARAIAQARDQLLDILRKEGLERVDVVDVPFDPTVHDAVAHTDVSGEGAAVAGEEDDRDRTANGSARHAVSVDEVLRAGYRWRGQVLRPAMVRVRG